MWQAFKERIGSALAGLVILAVVIAVVVILVECT